MSTGLKVTDLNLLLKVEVSQDDVIPIVDVSANILKQIKISDLPYGIGAGGGVSSFNDLTNKPTTIGGYGITDAYTKTEVDTTFSNYNYVDKTSNQTINGIKTFTDPLETNYIQSVSADNWGGSYIEVVDGSVNVGNQPNPVISLGVNGYGTQLTLEASEGINILNDTSLFTNGSVNINNSLNVSGGQNELYGPTVVSNLLELYKPFMDTSSSIDLLMDIRSISHFQKTITAYTILSFPTLPDISGNVGNGNPAYKVITLELVNGGSFNITFPFLTSTNIDVASYDTEWLNDTTPTLKTNGTDIIEFTLFFNSNGVIRCIGRLLEPSLKTINGSSILGIGDIAITSGNTTSKYRFVAIDNQTNFICTNETLSDPIVYLNGVVQDLTITYTYVGNTVTFVTPRVLNDIVLVVN
jgi:hypothetical protein